MLSESELTYVKTLIATYRSDYPYYVVRSVSYDGWDYDNNLPEIQVYFSKDEITANGYTYSFSSDTILLSINTDSYNYRDNSFNRINQSSFRGGTVNIPVYEDIYTNAIITESSVVMPDLSYDIPISQSAYFAISLVLIVTIISTALVRFFKT